jgi:5-methylcytosine-specific restriction endonuclease McrA
VDHGISETHLLHKRDAKRRFRDHIFQAWRGRCAYCGCAGATTLDHIKPRSRGGDTTTQNLAPACPDCNRLKGSSEVFSWFRLQPNWSPDREADLWLWIHQRCFGDSAASLLLATVDDE